MLSMRWPMLFVLLSAGVPQARADYRFVEFKSPSVNSTVTGSTGNIAFGYSGDYDQTAGYWPNGPTSDFVALTPLKGNTQTNRVYGSDGSQMVGWSGGVRPTLWNLSG